MKELLNLKGLNALVGGSTQGIGYAIAVELAKQNANVTLIARNEESLKTVVNRLPNSSDQKHSYLVADFSDPQIVKNVVSDHISKQNGFHIVINNTGGPPGGPSHTAKPEDFLAAFNQHLISYQMLLTNNIDFMKKANYGRIINIISTSVKQPIPNLGVSNTIRGAVANWAKTLANELGEFGITVNNVLPGMTLTSRLESIVATRAEKFGKTPEEIKEELLNTIPAKRFAQPNELGYAVAFLASPAASYINGINLPVDGGRIKSL